MKYYDSARVSENALIQVDEKFSENKKVKDKK